MHFNGQSTIKIPGSTSIGKSSHENLLIQTAPPAESDGGKLSQSNIAQQAAADHFGVFDALLDDLLFVIFAAVLLHTKLVHLVGKVIEGGHVFVGDSEANVPVIGARGRLIEKDVVIEDQAGALFRFPQRNDVLLQVAVKCIRAARHDAKEHHACDGALFVGNLGTGGNGRNDKGKEQSSSQTYSGLH